MSSTFILITILIIGFLALFALLLYGFNDIKQWNKKRTIGIMLHINICLAELEKRMSTGQLQDPEELEKNVERYVKQLDDHGVA